MIELNTYLTRYVETRGIPMPVYDSGSKIIEEAEELRDAVVSRDRVAVMEEVADVIITALVAARQFDVTAEAALEYKIAKDRGRGEKYLPRHRRDGIFGADVERPSQAECSNDSSDDPTFACPRCLPHSYAREAKHREDRPMPGCCSGCGGTGHSGDVETNGKCWGCYGTGHPHLGPCD